MFTTNSSKWLTRTVSFILVSSYMLATGFKVYAGSVPTAQAARVDRVRNNGNGNSSLEKIQMGEFDRRDTQDPKEGKSKLENLNQFLWVPGNGSEATLRYISRTGSAFGPGVLAVSDKNPSSYYFPCTLKGGSFIVGWLRGDERQCVPPGITVKRNGASRSSSRLLNQDSFQMTQGLKNLLTAQSSRNQMFRYCTVAAKNRGWWVRWGTFDDPCEEANQECLTTGSASGCQVVGLGDWRIKDQNLLVSVECASNQVFADRGNGQKVATSLIQDLAEKAKNDGSKACVLNVYQPDDVIVLPATKKVTLIQTHDFGNALAIDALAGDVIIKSAKHSVGVRLKVGNRYIYPDDVFQPINVSEVAKSPAVQAFLNPNNWSPDATAQLEDYRRAIGQSNKPSEGKNEIVKALPALAILGLFGLINSINDDGDSGSRRNRSTNNNSNDRAPSVKPTPTPTPTPTPIIR